MFQITKNKTPLLILIGGAILLILVFFIFTGGQDLLTALFRPQSQVPSIQPKALVSEPEVIPNDPDWEEQWAPVKIRAPEAWKITTGNRSIRVAIVSSGIDSSHPDLVDNMVPGYNSLNPGADTEDSNFMGTAVAGIIGAIGNNSRNIAGLNWQVSLMPIKACVIFDCDPIPVANGIRWAADNGAHIILADAISSQASSELEEAVSYAQSRGAIVVARELRWIDGELWFPGAYPGVVTVSDTNEDDMIVESDPERDIVAPGFNTLTIWPGGDTASMDGMGIAHVAGVLALLLSVGVSPNDAVQAIYDGAVDLGPPGWDEEYGWGRLDACGALNAAGIPCPIVDSDGDGCTDAQELGTDETLGGQRDPNNPYDFFDVPLPPGPPGTGTKNKVINMSDVFGVLSKFGTHNNGTPDDFTDDPPNNRGQVYNPDFDRSFLGPRAWNSGPPNGVINIFDVLRVLAQVGHSCLES